MLRYVLFATVILTSAAQAGDDTVDIFVMPSGNVSCVHGANDNGAGIYCLRYKPTLIAVSFKDGKLDFGPTYGDQPDMSSAKTFEYGAVKHYSDMTCSSLETGLECWADGRGFNLSRKGVKKL